MDFTLSKKHAMARALFREFAEKEVKPLAQEVDETEEFPRATVEKMAKAGCKFFCHHHHYEFVKMANGKTIFDYIIENSNLKDLKRVALEIVRNEENYGG